MTTDKHKEHSDAENNTPLVSVICRTMLRPELTEALESLANQTYPNIEVVLVNASGTGVVSIPEHLSRLNIKQVDKGKQLNRPLAANTGLDSAAGEYLLFLDEDDWIAPNHVEELVQSLIESDQLAVYSNTRRVTAAGEMLDEVFNQEFDLAILMRDNFMPIHSVLFSSSLLESGCRFDPTLEIFEDWDFWLQVSQHTGFVHLDVTSAFYRGGGQSETSVTSVLQKFESGHVTAVGREKVLQKWLPRWTGRDINRMVGALDQSGAIDELRDNLDQAHTAVNELRESLQHAHEAVATQREEIGKFQAAVSELETELISKEHALEIAKADFERQLMDAEVNYQHLSNQYKAMEQSLRDILNSFSWKITRPYRFLSARCKRWLIAPIKKLLVGFVIKSPALHKTIRGKKAGQSAENSEAMIGDEILFSIDSPIPENNLFSDTLVLQGWAVAQSGAVSIEVYIDGQEYFHFSPGVSRPDVMRLLPDFPDTANCGFFEKLSLRYLPSGEHQLSLNIRAESGAIEIFETEFLLYRSEEIYNAWLGYREEQLSQQLADNSSDAENPRVAVVYESSNDLERDGASVQDISQQTSIEIDLYYVGTNWDRVAAEIRPANGDAFKINTITSDSLADALAKASSREGYVAVVAAGCRLSPLAFRCLLDRAVSDKADMVYSDHDEIHATGTHSDPVFTFGWSPEHLISANYVGDVYLLSAESLNVSRSIVDTPAWRYRLLLELGIQSATVARVPEVLWSAPPLTAEAHRLLGEQEAQAVTAFLAEHRLPAVLEVNGESRSLKWQLADAHQAPKVSIIIPTMGKLSLVRPCLESLLENTDYPDYEVIILDNSRGQNPDGIAWLKDQDFKVIECNEPFNWARLNNKGAAIAEGQLLLFLNDDIEIRQANWLSELAGQAQREEIGAVGCKLLYPNGALQHAGVFLVNYGGGGLHLFHKMAADRHIYERLDLRVRETSAITGACLMVSREDFDAISGFDEELAVVGNDVDFCLRLLAKGKRNIWTPRCTLIHHESISREATVPAEDEQAMWKRWGRLFKSGDFYYNPNLSLTKWDCSQDYDMPLNELLDRLPRIDASIRDEIDTGLQEGVNLIGYIRADMGLGEGARSDARALDAAEIDFGIINFESGNPSSMTNTTWRFKEILNAPFDVNLIHINGDFLPLVIEELPAHFLRDRYNIAYWAWELEELPTGWVPALELVDEIWVPSDFVKEAVEKVSKIPVVTVPHNVALLPSISHDRSAFAIPEDSFVFLAMYDTRSIAERKNPRAALDAFKKAFQGDDLGVCLVLKLNNATDEAVAELESLIEGYANIVILRNRHSRQEVDSLLGVVDCFVSLHRSEGFGLGPLEAMSHGKPCILTNWSGNTEYMTADNCLAVDYELITIEQDHGPYNAGQRWADADVDQAASYMRNLATDPALAESIGRQARLSVEEGFSPHAVGQLVAERLDVIRRTLKKPF